MKYTPEIVAKIVKAYQQENKTAAEIAESLSTPEATVPERSVIAKLSSLGVYKRKEYKNKCGDTPTKKEEYIERIGQLLEIDTDLLESLEKVTKTALMLIERQVLELKKKD